MSYFLEDTKKRRSTSAVLVDYTGMNEALFNSEVAWGNIMESAMKSEYVAIKNESQTLLEGSVKETFNKIKEWFKNMIATIVRIVANIKNKILITLDAYGKFVINAKKILTKNKNFVNKDGKDTKVKYYTFNKSPEGKSILDASDKFIEIANEVIKNSSGGPESTVTKDNLKNRIAELDKTYKDAYDELKKKENYEEISLTQAFSLALVDLGVLESLSKAKLKTSLRDFDEAKRICQLGIAECDKSQDGSTEKIKNYKATITLVNQACSRYINTQMSTAAYIKGNVSRVLSKMKKADDKEQAKTESYFGF